MTLPTRPLEPTARAQHLDIVRGIAVFGLIWSNLNAGFYDGPLSSADAVARWATTVFSAGKFFTLFSLLFGVTLTIQLQRAESASQPFVRRWVRRMIVLYVIGWAHAILFWPGDILRDYAIAGLVLVLFKGASSRVVLLAAVACLALAASRDSLSVHLTRVTNGDVQAVQRREEPSSALTARRRAVGAAMRQGSYLDVVRTRAQVAPREQLRRASQPAGPLNWISQWYLGLFLLGLVLGRSRVVLEPKHHKGALVAMAGLGLGIGLPLNVYLASSPAWLANHDAYWPFAITARLALSFGYLGGLLWLLQRGAWQARLSWLAPVGRLALTNYIAQTAFITYLRLGYGLKLEPVLGWFECLLLAIAFYLVQVGWSNWWLRRFGFGPIEWLWRRFTYGSARAVSVSPAIAA